ncbi:MAG: hypothetical protein ACRC80_11295 [Waterburya sp.]
MTTEKFQTQANSNQTINQNLSKEEKILCRHCRRTAINGVKCKGICVADSDY